MNWQAKAALFLVTVFTISLTACEAPKEIGLPPEVIAEVQFTDTLTVKTSTVLLDSVRTNSTTQLLLGSYRDPIFGRVTAQPYFELGNRIDFNADGSTTTYVYDSLTLDLAYFYYYGDTLQPFQMNLHRLTDTLITGKTYYNNSTMPYEATPLATLTIDPKPATNNTFKFKLPDALGKQIFDLSGKPDASSASKFVQTFKGFTLVPSNNSSMIMGLPSSSGISLNLYVHITGDTVGKVQAIPLLKRFNHVQANRQGTEVAKLQPLKPLSAAEMGGLNYVQDALGIVTKVEFPHLSKLFTDGRVAINRAELNIVPEQPQGRFFLPTGLTMAETDQTNRLLRSVGGTELLLPVDGSTFQSYILPQISVYNDKFRNYNFVLTTYLQAVSIGFKKSTGLLLMPVSSTSSLVSLSQPLSIYYPYLNNRLERLTINPTRENVKLYIFYTTTK